MKKILDEMWEIYQKKNSDYGSSFERTMERFGTTAVNVRLSDKLERAISLAPYGHEPQVKDESLRDTYLDLANYAAMTVAWLDQKNCEKEGEGHE